MLLLMLASCTTLRFGYGNGERLAYWWLDGYVDFTADQKPKVKQELARLIAWHRSTELAEYSKLIEKERLRLRQPRVAEKELTADYEEGKRRARLIAQRSLPALADLALSLDAKQIRRIEAKFQENNERYRSDNLQGDLEDRQRSRFRKVMKQAEYWFGGFSREQEARIRAITDATVLDDEVWLQERMRRQQRLIGLLGQIRQEHPAREKTMSMLMDYIDSLDRGGMASLSEGDELNALVSPRTRLRLQTAASIINLVTPEQKAFADERLLQLKEDCKTLSSS